MTNTSAPAAYATSYDPFTDSWTVKVTGLPIPDHSRTFTVAEGGSKRAEKYGKAHLNRKDW